jgi:hypothetical protein
MRYRNEPAYAFEAEEARDAARAAERDSDYTPCYRHDWASDHRGGGVCRHCGDTVSEDEL